MSRARRLLWTSGRGRPHGLPMGAHFSPLWDAGATVASWAACGLGTFIRGPSPPAASGGGTRSPSPADVARYGGTLASPVPKKPQPSGRLLWPAGGAETRL